MVSQRLREVDLLKVKVSGEAGTQTQGCLGPKPMPFLLQMRRPLKNRHIPTMVVMQPP